MKSLLVKRLESSFFAFKQSVNRFVESYRAFIGMFEGGRVLIGKEVNVYELLEADDQESITRFIESERLTEYQAADFREEYIEHLKHDLALLEQIQELWQPIDDDPKLDKFVAELQNNAQLKDRKTVIFTESKETGEYLFTKLDKAFPGTALFFCSSGGRFGDANHTPANARDLIKDNFDPNRKTGTDDIKLLITTLPRS